MTAVDAPVPEAFANPYCRHTPTHAFCPYSPEQELFSASPAFEVFFGGAAGPGKTITLLNEGTRQIDKRGYRAIFFRRSYKELVQVIEMAHETFPLYGGRYHKGEHIWRFPLRASAVHPQILRGRRPGATYQFAYCERDADRFRYQGGAWAYIAWDELTQYATDAVYTYLFLRCRPLVQGQGIECYVRAASNPGGPGHCLEGDSEVLTVTGWQRISDARVGTLVATLDAQEQLVYRPVEQVHASWFEGDLVVGENTTTTFRCTPQHQLVRRTETKRSSGRTWHAPSFIRADRLSTVTRLVRAAKGYRGHHLPSLTLTPVVTARQRRPQPLTVSGDDYATLAGWMVSEGWTLVREREQRGTEHLFGIAQQKRAQRAAIRRLLTRTGFRFREDAGGFTVASVEWTAHWRASVGSGSREKRMPEALRHTTRRQLQLFFDAAMAGDGSLAEHVYWTTSQRLADDMMEVGLKLGYSPRLGSRQRANRDGPSYHVSFRRGRDSWIEARHVTRVPYRGPVYCIGVPDFHRFFVRQDGNVWLSGNSWCKLRFIEGRRPFLYYKEVVEDPVLKRQRHYWRQWIPATLDSNDILMRSTMYEVGLLSYPDPEIRRAMRHGDWNIAAGVMFSELRERHHRVPARPPLADTRKEIAIDWGYGHFAVAGWFETTSGVSDAVPHSVLYREFVINKCPPPLFAQMLAERTPLEEEIGRLVLDSEAWATTDDGGPSPAEQMLPVFKQRGWKLVPATKGAGSRRRGWYLLHTYFYERRRGGPLLRVMDNCPVTWHQLTSLVRGIEPHDVEDLEPHQVDDAADMVRYWAQSRPEPGPPTEAEVLMRDEDLDKLLDPASYEVAKIERLRQVGFPEVRVRRPRQRRPHTTKKPWSPA